MTVHAISVLLFLLVFESYCVNDKVELQWLEQVGNHENMCETGVDQARECLI